jgi:purine-cytosine permease-like protein
VRYLPSTLPARPIFRHVFWSSFIPCVAITMMGAACATLGDMSDPVAGLKPFVPSGLFVVYIFAVVAGSLANNVSTYYSSGLSLQAVGLKLHRYAATMLDVALSAALSLYLLFVRDFTTALNDFVALLVVWVGPFGGVWICDALLCRHRYDVVGIHSRDRAAGRYWGWHGMNLSGLTALAAGMTAAALTMMSPLYDGPLATALGGTDLSWCVGLPVAAASYWGLSVVRRAQAVGVTRARAAESET